MPTNNPYAINFAHRGRQMTHIDAIMRSACQTFTAPHNTERAR